MTSELSVNNAARATSAPADKIVVKRAWSKTLLSFLRRLPLEIVNVLINYDWLFWLAGLINKRAGALESVFLVYPASKKYALAYVFPYRLPKVQWNPWPCGLLRQNGKYILMFCVSATAEQFNDPQNIGNLGRMSDRMETIRRLLAANGKTFAGILPGVLYSKKIIRQAPEARLTAKAVLQAIDRVTAIESLDAGTPIIVLGGKGFVGRRVMRQLNRDDVYSIDSADGHDQRNWPNHLKGRRVIVVNITQSKAIDNYLEVMWPGTVVINEVYPEPSPETLDSLKAKGCACYHVVGIDATAVPSFPAAYKGAIPCCAAWPSPNMKVVVRKIN